MLYSDIIQVEAELICTLSYRLNLYLQLPVQSDVANKLVYFEFNVKKKHLAGIGSILEYQ